MISSLVRRADYPCLTDDVYLNQAALGLIGQPAVQAMHDFIENVARHGNLRMSDAEEVGFFETLRSRGAKILDCETDQLAIVASASELLGQLPYMIRPIPGADVLLVSTDFPAVTRPWIQYGVANDCTTTFIDDRPTENLTDRLIESITEKTAVVAVSHVQYATGSVVDIPRLRDATARVNVRLVVDVTQAAGLLPVRSRAWQADAVVTSGYKWLGAHGGVALAAISPNLFDIFPALPGWMSSPNPFEFDASNLAFAVGARRLTLSTMSYVSIAGLIASLDGLLELSDEQRADHSQSLKRRLLGHAQLHGWTPFRQDGDPSASPHIVALSNPDVRTNHAFETLRRNRVICGVRNNHIRISLAPYNNSDDIDTLASVLAEL